MIRNSMRASLAKEIKISEKRGDREKEALNRAIISQYQIGEIEIPGWDTENIDYSITPELIACARV
jgi:hypothetical protein